MGFLDKILKTKSVKSETINLTSYTFSRQLDTKEEIPITHYTTITKNLHTQKKNYYKLTFDNLKKNTDIALYVAPQFAGISPVALENTVKSFAGLSKRPDYPLYLSKSKVGNLFLRTDLQLILTNCRDIHMEIDEKEGVMTTKYILHCADDEDGYDMYFVFYDNDLPKEVINILMYPSWRSVSN